MELDHLPRSIVGPVLSFFGGTVWQAPPTPLKKSREEKDLLEKGPAGFELRFNGMRHGKQPAHTHAHPSWINDVSSR